MPNPTADFPTTLHTPTDISTFGGDALGATSPDHIDVHGKVEEELQNLGEKIGTGASTPATNGHLLISSGGGASAWGNAIPLGITINESGADSDTRIEGDTSDQLMVVDAGLNAFRIGDTVAGSIADFRPTGIVFNEAGADMDIRFESDTNANMFFLDSGLGRIGLGTDSPDFTLHGIGGYQFDDALTATKAMRYRFGGSMDWEFAGSALIISGWDNADFSGTQREKLLLKIGEDTSGLCGDWEVVLNPFDAAHHWIGGGALNGDFTINEDGQNTDFRVETDDTTHMLFISGDGAASNAAWFTTAEPNWQAMDRGFYLGNTSTAPTGNPSGGGFLYVTGGALTYRGSGGTITTIGPA